MGEDGGINGIGLGPLALGAGEVADPAGFQNADGNVGGLERPDDRLFIAAGGFANDLRFGMSPQQFEQLGMTFGVIGQRV